MNSKTETSPFLKHVFDLFEKYQEQDFDPDIWEGVEANHSVN